MNIDKVREYIVIVNNGSGCIFQPEDDAYSYVLTAKHNIANENIEIIRFVFENNCWKEIAITTGQDMACYFPHPDKDIAIIKINKVGGLEHILRLDDFEDDRTGFSLCGYPTTRRSFPRKNQFRIDENVTVQGTKNNQLREAKVPDNPSIDEIVGQSGGAIVKMKDGQLFLAGIQNKMADAKNEQLGRVEFTPLTSFDEIIRQRPEALSPLSPPYVKSFEYLKQQVMKLEGCFCNLIYTKQLLQDFTDDIIKDPLTPTIIKNHFKKRLLVRNEKETSLNNKGLWIAWLELLIILKIIGKYPQTEQDLDDIFNQYRIIYSSSKEDWCTLIEDILCSDYKGLKENACIIIANEAKPSKSMIKKGIIQNIAWEISPNQMNIDDGENRSMEQFKHIHLYAFQEQCIIEKEEEYTVFNNRNRNELLQKLKQEYENVINNY